MFAPHVASGSVVEVGADGYEFSELGFERFDLNAEASDDAEAPTSSDSISQPTYSNGSGCDLLHHSAGEQPGGGT